MRHFDQSCMTLNEAAGAALAILIGTVGLELGRRWQIDGRWVRTHRALKAIRNIALFAAVLLLVVSLI